MRRWLVVAALALLCLPMAQIGNAQEATPAPDVRVELFDNIQGIEWAAVRSFEVPGGTITGVSVLTIYAAEFRTFGLAAVGREVLLTNYPVFLQRHLEEGTTGELSPASVRAIGDESAALAGTISNPQGTDSPVTVIASRKGSLVFLICGTSSNGSPMAETADVLERLIERTPGESSPTVGTDGLHYGGIWDVFPALADVPEGFVLHDEVQLI